MTDRIHPLLAIFAGLVFLFLVGPLIIMIGASLSDTNFLTFPPRGLTLHWFTHIFEVTAFKTTAITSLELAFAGTLLSLLFGIPAAYALNRFRVELPSWLSTVYVLPILIPEIVFGFSLMKSVTIDSGFPVGLTLLIGHALLVLPYSVRVVSASLAAFDFSIEEAAISLGSPPLKTFFTIVLPNIRAGRDRGLHPRLHHLDQRCVRLALPDRAGHLDAAHPDPGLYGAVLRSHHGRRLRASHAPDRGRDGHCRGDAGPHLPDEIGRP